MPNDDRGPFAFAVAARDGRARAGRMRTPHGAAATPAFMAVGTAATVKALTPAQVRGTGVEVVLCNTYHLALRPGERAIERLGGLHAFMKWDGPILTDSGGFQVFSLGALTEVDADGVTFKNHLDGAKMRLGPERAIEIQTALGSDIAMVFDECLPYPSDEDRVRRSLFERTLPWEVRSLAAAPRDGRACFAIGQGGFYPGLREECLRELTQHPFDGFALGGLSVGESFDEYRAMVDLSTALLPEDKPRYVMGVGTPRELLAAVGLGVDLFDCVLPTPQRAQRAGDDRRRAAAAAQREARDDPAAARRGLRLRGVRPRLLARPTAAPLRRRGDARGDARLVAQPRLPRAGHGRRPRGDRRRDVRRLRRRDARAVARRRGPVRSPARAPRR
jgi:queuine tRNA-ribosyltransferase